MSENSEINLGKCEHPCQSRGLEPGWIGFTLRDLTNWFTISSLLYNLWKVGSFQIAQPIKAYITARPPESHAHRFFLSSAHVAEEFLHIIQKGISIMAQEQKGSIPKYMLFFFYSFQIFTQQYMKLNSTIHKKDSTFTKTISTFDILIVEMTF